MLEQDTELNNTNIKKPFINKGFLFACCLIVAFIALSYQSTVSAIYCDEDASTPKPDIIMLSTSWCPYCKQARRYFTNNDMKYCEYDIERSTIGNQIYNSVNGQAVPVILIGDTKLNGFSERAITQALAKLHST